MNPKLDPVINGLKNRGHDLALISHRLSGLADAADHLGLSALAEKLTAEANRLGAISQSLSKLKNQVIDSEKP